MKAGSRGFAFSLLQVAKANSSYSSSKGLLSCLASLRSHPRPFTDLECESPPGTEWLDVKPLPVMDVIYRSRKFRLQLNERIVSVRDCLMHFRAGIVDTCISWASR